MCTNVSLASKQTMYLCSHSHIMVILIHSPQPSLTSLTPLPSGEVVRTLPSLMVSLQVSRKPTMSSLPASAAHNRGVPPLGLRGVAQLFPALPGNPPWPEKEGVVRRLCARVPRTRCGVCDSFLLASQLSALLPTRGRICARVCAKPHPLLVLLALCGCGSADCALCGAACTCVAQPVPSRSVVSCTSARVIS